MKKFSRIYRKRVAITTQDISHYSIQFSIIYLCCRNGARISGPSKRYEAYRRRNAAVKNALYHHRIDSSTQYHPEKSETNVVKLQLTFVQKHNINEQIHLSYPVRSMNTWRKKKNYNCDVGVRGNRSRTRNSQQISIFVAPIAMVMNGVKEYSRRRNESLNFRLNVHKVGPSSRF